MHRFLITIDVEDWFQVENLRPWNPPAVWDRRELRVEANVHKLLDLFDSLKPPSLPASQLQAYGAPCTPHRAPSNFQPDPVNPVKPSFPRAPCAVRRASFISATFFILGWIAERLPQLVREITARGHEVASHGMNHRMCRPLADAELREELGSSKRLLEDITGAEVAGFRAPNFSVDDRVLAFIREAGYRYDSSYNSFSLHGRYGKITLNGQPKAGIAYEIFENFFELPLSNLTFSSSLSSLQPPASNAKQTGATGFVLPWSGGAYFRLMPLALFRRGARKILEGQGAYLFYAHPWEFDPGQPRVEEASWFARFKHYRNIETTPAKLAQMIKAFSGCRFLTCRDYLEEMFRQDQQDSQDGRAASRVKLHDASETY